jgi:hypothetical protein
MRKYRKMKTITYTILITILLTFSVSAQNAARTESPKTENAPKTNSNQKNREIEEEMIYEIIFRKVIEPWNSQKNNSLKVYYFAINGNENPSENTLKKFADNKVAVKKISELAPTPPETIIDSLDELLAEKSGVIFSISKLQWKNEFEVLAQAGSYIGNMGSNGCEYTLKKEDGTWKITSEEKCYVS